MKLNCSGPLSAFIVAVFAIQARGAQPTFEDRAAALGLKIGADAAGWVDLAGQERDRKGLYSGRRGA